MDIRISNPSNTMTAYLDIERDADNLILSYGRFLKRIMGPKMSHVVLKYFP